MSHRSLNWTYIPICLSPHLLLLLLYFDHYSVAVEGLYKTILKKFYDLDLKEKKEGLDKILKGKGKKLYEKIKAVKRDAGVSIGELAEDFFDWIASIDPVSNTTYEIAAWNYSPLSCTIRMT